MRENKSFSVFFFFTEKWPLFFDSFNISTMYFFPQKQLVITNTFTSDQYLKNYKNFRE